MNITERWEFDRLRQRRDWLDARQKAKASIGWNVEYDCQERDALTWALDILSNLDAFDSESKSLFWYRITGRPDVQG